MTLVHIAVVLGVCLSMVRPVSANVEVISQLKNLANVVRGTELGTYMTEAEIVVRILREEEYRTQVFTFLRNNHWELMDRLDHAIRDARTKHSQRPLRAEVSNLVKTSFAQGDVLFYRQRLRESVESLRKEYHQRAVSLFEEAIRRVFDPEYEMAIQMARTHFGAAYRDVLRALEHWHAQPRDVLHPSVKEGPRERMTREGENSLSLVTSWLDVTVEQLLTALDAEIAFTREPLITYDRTTHRVLFYAQAGEARIVEAGIDAQRVMQRVVDGLESRFELVGAERPVTWDQLEKDGPTRVRARVNFCRTVEHMKFLCDIQTVLEGVRSDDPQMEVRKKYLRNYLAEKWRPIDLGISFAGCATGSPCECATILEDRLHQSCRGD